MTITKLWRDYNLSIVLVGLFLLSWIAQGVFQWQEYLSQAEMHQQAVLVSDFINEFLAATFENWQSEFLQLFTMVALTAVLIHKGSAESKDSNEEMQASLNRIERKLDRKK